MNGFLLLDKPSGISSSSCVYSLRKLLNEKKIGHCGTLDPLATGILPVCIGEGTKFSNFVLNHKKEYRVTLQFGVETDSGDISGQVIYREDCLFSKKELEASLRKYKGFQNQLPPMHSALKIKGRPSYYWVRKGIYFRRKLRNIEISRIHLLSFKKNKAIIQVSCSKGTYIRSLVESIGRDLKSAATVSELRRTKLGTFRDKDLFKLEGSNKFSCEKAILNCDSLLKHLPKVTLDSFEIKKVRNGQQLDYNAGQEKEGIVRVYEEKGSFIGLANIDLSMKLYAKRLISFA